ncbi:MAG: class I SAM-dependent methyltransferase [Burkholderiales bacterium]|nr:class I SAM-dependent methyltransferase [Burkholderiales bacterium]
MPFSQSSQISCIVGAAERLQPQSILDVGAGMGQYGFLLRTNLENIHLFEIDAEGGRQTPRERWTIRIDGIEGFAAYLTPVHEYAYDRVMVGDAMQLLPDIADAHYDLVLAIDILEHLDVEQGIAFLRHCRRIARRMVLVSTPKAFVEQQVEANPFENHRSLWSREDLAAQGFATVLPNQESWIATWQAAA